MSDFMEQVLFSPLFQEQSETLKVLSQEIYVQICIFNMVAQLSIGQWLSYQQDATKHFSHAAGSPFSDSLLTELASD